MADEKSANNTGSTANSPKGPQSQKHTLLKDWTHKGQKHEKGSKADIPVSKLEFLRETKTIK